MTMQNEPQKGVMLSNLKDVAAREIQNHDRCTQEQYLPYCGGLRTKFDNSKRSISN